MISLFKLKNTGLLVCVLGVWAQIAAQTLNVLPVMLKPNEVTSLPYMSVDNQESMSKVRLAKENYPVIIMQKQVFSDVHAISIERTKLIAELEKSKFLGDSSERISKLQIFEYQKQVEIYKSRLNECDSLNARLNRSFMTMNSQYDEAIKLVEKPMKWTVMKKVGIGTLGGIVGFSLATLLGAFK